MVTARGLLRASLVDRMGRCWRLGCDHCYSPHRASCQATLCAETVVQALVVLCRVVLCTTVALSIVTNRATLFGYEPFRVPSASMSPTIEDGDFVMADTWRYLNHAPVVGEIVIVERPYSKTKYIKRVVGIAGDSVEIRDGVIYRNGFAIDEPYLHWPMSSTGSPLNVPAWTLGPGLIYVLGDYRDNSLDSRQWGPLPISSLRGRAQYIWLSIDGESRFRWTRVGIRLRP